MARNELTDEDRDRIRAARKRGEARQHDASALTEAAYDRTADALRLTFRSGASMTIPRSVVPGLEGRASSALRAVTLSPGGDALSWRHLDLDVYVPGLIERAFGRLFATEAATPGGKVAAARRTGQRGLPQKR